jgi:hypothetical protein
MSTISETEGRLTNFIKTHLIKIAVGFMILTLLRDAIALSIFSYSVTKDSLGYIGLGQLLFDRNAPFIPYRSLPYLVLNASTVSSYNPIFLIWSQIIVGAFALGALVFVVGQENGLLAVLIGSFLVSELAWGNSNLIIQTEGPLISFLLLSMTAVLYHANYHKLASTRSFVLAGMLFAWTASIRPSGIYMLLVIPLAYLLLTRSWQKTLWVSAGAVALLIMFGIFNLWRNDSFRQYGQSGIYVGWPIFLSQTLDPDHGSASVQLDQEIRQCMPDVDYTSISVSNSNDIIWRRFVHCLRDQGHTYDEISNLLAAVLIESVKGEPLQFGKYVAGGSLEMLRYNIANRTYYHSKQQCRGVNYSWCPSHPPQLASFLKVADVLIAMYAPTGYLRQPYLLLVSQHQILTVGLGWISYLFFTFLLANRQERVLVLSCAFFILYTILIVPAGHAVLFRYTIPTGPFHSILAAIFISQIIHIRSRTSVLLKTR